MGVCSKCGWDHVVEGLVMLGFHLMDTCAPKTSSELAITPVLQCFNVLYVERGVKIFSGAYFIVNSDVLECPNISETKKPLSSSG